MPKNTIYKGDTITNFGKNFPVPYIERVELYDVLGEEREDLTEIIGFELGASQKVSKITVKISMLFNTDDDFMLEGFVEDLFNDLNLNFFVLTSEERITSLKESKRNLKDLMADMSSDMEDSESSGTESADPDTDTPTYEGLWSQIKSVPLSNYSADIVFTGEYDENTNKILKSSNIVYDLYVPSIKSDLTDLTIFVGTSAGTPSYLMQLKDIVLAMSFSDLAYEDIKKQDSLDNKNKVGFFDEGNGYYPGRPIVALNANYHKSEGYDQEDIKEEVNNLKSQYEEYLQADGDLQNVFDNLDAIYYEYGETPRYLAQLNRYRSNMMNQDVTTFAGKFYERYRILINNANTKLLESPQVFKRITYASKIRDFRPSQFAGEIESTFDEDLEHEDFIYRQIFQTNVAKYVSTTSEPGDDVLHHPEAPYTPSEMKQSYIDAISAVFSRFHAATGEGMLDNRVFGAGATTIPKGTDNIENWLTYNSDAYLSQAKAMFKCSIGKFISWATGTEYSCEDSEFGTAESRRIYRGGYGGLGDTSADEREGLYLPGRWTDDELEVERNIKAFRSAQRLFGEHGNPSAGCTLEFGYDAPKVGGGWFCDRQSAFSGDARAMHTEYSITQDRTALTSDTKYAQYKCFTQQLPIINIVGHGSSKNEGGEDIEWDGDVLVDPGRFGAFLRLRDNKGSYGDDWNLMFPRDIMDRITDILEEDFGGMSGLGAGYGEHWTHLISLVTTAGNVVNTRVDPDNNEFVQMVRDEDKWNALVAEYDLLNSDGEVRSGKLNLFANAYADNIYDIMSSVFDLGAVATTNRTYRLRWCPDNYSDSDWLDSNRGVNNNPYGGKWEYLWVDPVKRRPDGDAWTSSADGGTPVQGLNAKPYYYGGGCGGYARLSGEFGSSENVYTNQGSSLDAAGIGRATWNLYSTLQGQVMSTWYDSWRTLLVDAIKDVVPLLAELHGLNVSTGLHRRLAYMDIVVAKYGWFFFDLEKYIQKQSILSRFMNPQTFEKYFADGRDMINRSIRIDDVTFRRWNAAWHDGHEDWRSLGDPIPGANTTSLVEMIWNPDSSQSKQPTDILKMKFESSCADPGPTGGKCPFAKIKQMDVAGWSDICMQKDDSGEMQLLDPDGNKIKSYNQWSYLMQRNYDFAYDTAVPDKYRLACFAYNYYLDDDVAIHHPDAMRFSVTVRDRSDLIIKKLRNILTSINNEYQEYAELARENCAYNSFDSQFNQFFIDQMDQQYVDNMEMAPWLRAPSAYVIFQDLIYGLYGAEWSVVLDAARNISDRINPYTGDLESVEDYSLKFNEMIELIDGIYADVVDTVFDSTGEIRELEKMEYYIGRHWYYMDSEIDIVINKGIIDYASDHTSEYPDRPDASRDR